MAGLGEVGLIALLTENLLVFEDKRRTVELLEAATADEVFGMPHTTHGTGKRTTGVERRRREREGGREGEREGGREGGREGALYEDVHMLMNNS